MQLFYLPFTTVNAMPGLLMFLWTTYGITDRIGGPALTCGQQSTEVYSEVNTW